MNQSEDLSYLYEEEDIYEECCVCEDYDPSWVMLSYEGKDYCRACAAQQVCRKNLPLDALNKFNDSIVDYIVFGWNHLHNNEWVDILLDRFKAAQRRDGLEKLGKRLENAVLELYTLYKGQDEENYFDTRVISACERLLRSRSPAPVEMTADEDPTN